MDSDLLLTEGLHISQDPLVAVSRNSCKKLKQWQQWSLEVIPSLIQPFLEYKRLSDNLRNEVVRESSICGNDCPKRKLKIVRVTFSVLTVCPCMPAALQLLRKGYFPCAPLTPMLAVHIKVLCLVKELFVRIPPNTSAWCEALESFFRSLGYKVDAKEGIRRQFSNAYHWYCPGSQDDQQSAPTSPKQPSNIPSEYLRHRCPLCFSGANTSISDAIICIDACFTQKRRSGHEDDPRNPTGTVFLPQADLDEMEANVEVLRNPPRVSKPTARRKGGHTVDQAQDTYEDGMRILTSVLDGCNDSFLAADETRQKVRHSRIFFSDTGIMALLCRHDCVIYLANMTSAGEKQHYTLTLLKALFDQLPLDFRVGVLYDIGCQLECSCRKWEFLETFLPCRTFAISVFHAFGHQWPCQLIYHPRKQAGFALSDGEGCERFWSAIRPLIPSLHVSGFHQRLFVIDFQVRHLDRKSLANLGGWLRRRWDHCQEKKKSALDGLNKSGVDRATLHTEWQAQVATQTKPTPRCSWNKGEEAVMQIISIHKSLEAQEATLHELESSQLLGNIDVVTLDIQLADCHSNISWFKCVLRQKRAALGVGEQANLAQLRNNAYLQLRMNARALKARLRDRL
ncbi:hypothetical protein BU15DRAFT_57316 [Melanogaster broomeanus]|nr:hypothetical protein BU15DRAFT_57316 [Melanogaster broomeanus]